MIDLNALKADVAIAESQGRKFCQVHYSELQSLIARAEMMEKVQYMVPFVIGYCSPDDVHHMIQRKLFRVGLQLKKGPKYSMEVVAMYLPTNREKALARAEEVKQS